MEYWANGLNVERWTLDVSDPLRIKERQPATRAFTVPGGWLFSRHTSVKEIYIKIRRWVAELLLVFIGVYAAFWLNNLQQHQEQARQRDQILASLEQELEVGINNAREQTAQSEEEVRGFQRPLQNGERPKLSRFTFTTDYNPGDIATLLQAGGISLLEVKTLSTLREFESVVRWGLSRMAHYQKLSDELIAPNLGQDPSFFYQEDGRHLRAQFDFYAEALQARRDFFNNLQEKEAQLLSQIKSERQRR